MNIRSLLAKSSAKRAWHATYFVTAGCADVVKHDPLLIYYRVAVKVSMEVKSSHTKESGGSAFVPINKTFQAVINRKSAAKSSPVKNSEAIDLSQ
ncbi:hypothetical protein FXB40_12135 [Bradyrhizobium rifense]|uniref:Uncharacterized protein n=1 Tax=Bradyrhizobium rifense TaxID=515499 RepID=A0A5D3KHM8_9BRAD|nr:hypothetical protein [Bradyrhizobium rifense]TYL96370.1 hypothetical protein FXB40_12135 [Bradyrhizobium rifense]